MDLTILTKSNYPDAIKNVQIIDVRDKLPVNKRYTWASLKGVRPLTSITRIFFHHTGMSKASTASYSDLVLMQNIAKSHINSSHNIPNGDPGYCYHLTIRSGKVYYTSSIESLVFGVANANTDSISISVAGNYAGVDTLTDEDRNALYAAILLVEANVPTIKSVLGHKEALGASTACPGFSCSQVRTDLEAIKLSAAVTNTAGDNMAKVYATKVRIDDLYKTATGSSKYAETAQQYLLQVNAFMKSKGLL